MEKIKMAVVGAGGVWGQTHISIYKEHPLADVTAICDLSKEQAYAAAEKLGVPEEQVYTDYQIMLKNADIDAVAIVTPDFAHTDIAIACAEAKKHMLIEKPLATTADDIYRIMDAIEKNGVRAMVDLHNRWSPPFNKAWQEINSGKYGSPCTAYFRLNDVRWVATDMLKWAAKSSILWFLGSHSLDTLRWLVGSEPKEIYSVKHEGVLRKLGVEAVDSYLTTIKFRNGTIAQMENGWIDPNGNGCINDIKFNMVLEHGKIDIDASSHNMIQISTDEKTFVPDVLVSNFIFDRCKGFAYESIRSFIDKLWTGGDFLVSLKDAANTSLAILKLMESSEKGCPVVVDNIF
jgi:Predicted dehydrogenases and related proteins